MSTFTLRLSEVLELTDDIGLNEYPIFDEDYRATLNRKIIDRYFLQEIGVETVDQFVFFMRRKMNEIMPFYNELYKSTLFNIDPLNSVNIVTVIDADASSNMNTKTNNSSTSDGTATSKARAVSSETPQGMLNGSGDYATSANDSSSATDNRANVSEDGNTVQGSEQESKTVSNAKGFQGSQADLVMRYREAILNVDILILDELAVLFMQVWNNGDSYTNDNLIGFPLFGRF